MSRLPPSRPNPFHEAELREAPVEHGPRGLDEVAAAAGVRDDPVAELGMAPGRMLDFSDEFARPLQIEDAASDSGLGHILRVLQETMEVFRNARNAEGLYTPGANGGQRKGDAKRLSRWQDLLRKMQAEGFAVGDG